MLPCFLAGTRNREHDPKRRENEEKRNSSKENATKLGSIVNWCAGGLKSQQQKLAFLFLSLGVIETSIGQNP